MSSSDSTILDTVTEPLTDSFERMRRRLSRYDCALAAIPLTFLGAAVASAAAAIPTEDVLVAASLVGALVVADALFVHPPMRGSRPN